MMVLTPTPHSVANWEILLPTAIYNFSTLPGLLASAKAWDRGEGLRAHRLRTLNN